MRVPAPSPDYDAAAALSRSLFGFALCAWLPMCLAFVSLALAPSPTQSVFAQLHKLALIGFGAFMLLALLLLIWLYRLEPAQSARVVNVLMRLLGSPWLALGSLIALLELNILAGALLRQVAAVITDPARLLLFCWSLVFAGIVLTIHWRGLSQAFHRQRNRLAIAFVALAVIGLALLLSLLTSRLIMAAGLHDELRGRLDYRPLRFIDEGSAIVPSPGAFWAEQSKTRVRWLPYSYWAVAPFAGQFINVAETGLRRTISESEISLPSVYFFGGSTAWGEGARDAYTIPSQVARLLGERDHAVNIVNYAQTGYVSGQDLILFQRQLALGNLPDLAVFYQGFNDIYAAFTGGQAGLPMQEVQRVADAEAGRLLRQFQPVLRPLDVHNADLNWTLAATGESSPQAILDSWNANRRLIRAAAGEFGVDALFIWQPAFFAKRSLSGFEAQYAAEIERKLPGFHQLYADVDQLLRQLAASEPDSDLLIISDLFADHADEIFIDEAHINEVGNQAVAEAIVGEIAARLGSS